MIFIINEKMSNEIIITIREIFSLINLSFNLRNCKSTNEKIKYYEQEISISKGFLGSQ
jgi:hypothetical protein